MIHQHVNGNPLPLVAILAAIVLFVVGVAVFSPRKGKISAKK